MCLHVAKTPMKYLLQQGVIYLLKNTCPLAFRQIDFWDKCTKESFNV